MHITNRQMKAARELLGWEQTDLAAASGVSVGTIRRMEGARQKSTDAAARNEPMPIRGNHETVMQVLSAFNLAGIEFLNQGAPGVRLHPTGGELHE